MAQYEYKIASGHNNSAGLVFVEDFINNSLGRTTGPIFTLVGSPVPAGSVRRIALSDKVTDNGVKIITWRFSLLPRTAYNALITAYLGDFDTGSANVTIRTRKRDDTFANYNAVMVAPTLTDYTRLDSDYIQDLVITFRRLIAI